MRFLIIDNNQDDRERIKQVLQKEFYGSEFLEVVRREDFGEAILRGNSDMALTDYLLDWTDGLWVLKTMKERFPDMPVIMVTDTGSEEIAVEGLKSGLSDYVLKRHLHRLPVAVTESLDKMRLGKKINEGLKIFKMLFSEIRDLAYVCDTQGNILYVNKIFEKFTGRKPEEFFGKPFSPLFDEENLKKAMDIHARAVKGENLQFELCFKDTGILCEYRNFHLRDEEGNIVRTIGIARDVTEHRRAEEALRKSEEKYRTLVNEINDGFFIIDDNAIFTFANKALADIHGVDTPDELVGKSFEGLLTPEVRDEIMQNFRSSIRTAKFPNFIEVPIIRKKNKSLAFIEIRPVPIIKDGRVIGSRGIVRDITERKQTQAIDVLFHEIDHFVLQGQTLDFVLSHVCARLVDLFAYPLVWIGMKEADGTVSTSAKAGTHISYLNDHKVCCDNNADDQCPIVLATRGERVQTGNMQGTISQQCQERASRYGLQSFAVLPLSAQGRVLGTLTLYALKPNAFDAKIIQVLENIAAHISLTLLIGMDQLQLRMQSAAMASVANAIFITDCDGYIRWINNAFTRLSGYTADEVYGKSPRLFKSGKHDTQFYQQIWQTIRAGEVWRGEVVNRRKDGGLYTVNQTITPLPDTHGKAYHFVAIHEDITARKEAEERVIYMAHYDTLTNLPNRTLFHDRLQQEMLHAHRNKRLAAIMFLDLDRFKIVNDTLGHAFGDQLLKALAERLKGCVREGDTVSRRGGDEFTFVISDIAHPQDASHIAHKILDVVSTPFQIEGHEVHVTPSIGIAVYPLDADDRDSLIKKADIAMYHAKEHGGSAFKFYMEDMNINTFERLTLENDLRKALEKGELLIYYQPLIDQNTGQIISMEALLRWQHSNRGMIYPAKFIPIAEETGMIMPIGEWVMMKACSQTRLWHDAGFSPLRITVNLSARQFRQQNLVNTIRQVLQITGIDPHCLELELTEGIVMRNEAAILTKLHELKALGILLSIDDFGTEYSSLSYLKRFPIDTLKIDKSFVQDITTNPDDAAIVTAIIAIAESLKLKVVAEGVESKEQAAVLRQLHCNNIQGYVYSHPLPAADIERLLQKEYNTDSKLRSNVTI